MNNQQYQALCNQHPTLTSEGFGVNMAYSDGLPREDFFQARRRELEEAFQEFNHCIEWLKSNDIEDGRNAHYWKDRVQRDCRPLDVQYFHIPRGAFILAALFSGLEVRQMDGSTDAWICSGKETTP